MFTKSVPQVRTAQNQSMENPPASKIASPKVNELPDEAMSLVPQPTSTTVIEMQLRDQRRLKLLYRLQRVENIYDNHAYSYFLKLLYISRCLIQSESLSSKSMTKPNAVKSLLNDIADTEDYFKSLLSVDDFIRDKQKLANLIDDIARGADLTDQLFRKITEHIAVSKKHHKTSNASILATINEDNDDEEEVKPVSGVKPVSDVEPVSSVESGSFNKHSPLCITLMKNAAKREINGFFNQRLNKQPTDVNVNQLGAQKDPHHPLKMIS